MGVDATYESDYFEVAISNPLRHHNYHLPEQCMQEQIHESAL
jgi:hypothetical protein